MFDSASNRNEYQEHFLGVEAADAYADNLPPSLPSRNLGTLTFWSPLGTSGPVMGLIYLHYAHRQKLATMMLITTLVVSFLVCCRLEVRCD